MIHCKEGDNGQAYGMPRHLVDPVAEAISTLIEDVRRLKEKAGVTELETDTEIYDKHWKSGGI
jgi:hypothetical protein